MTTFAQAAAAAAEFADQLGHRFLHANDNPDVVAGQGTVAAEVVADAPEVDAVVVAAGGGGLAAGTALAAGPRHTVTVEPRHCQSVHDGLAAGHPVDSTVDSVAASALGASRLGELPFAILSSNGVRCTLVSDEQLLAAAGPAVGGVPDRRRTRRRRATGRLVGRSGPRPAALPGGVRRQHRLDPRLKYGSAPR